MTDVLHGDIETRSRADLKKEGLYRYSENPSTQILCFAFAFNHEQVCLWVPGYLGIQFYPEIDEQLRTEMQRRFLGSKCFIGEPPSRLVEHIRSKKRFKAHNAMFEFENLNRCPDFPTLVMEQMDCTQAKCAAYGLPQKLEKAAVRLGTHLKDTVGANDMRYLTRPNSKGEWREPIDHPDRFISMCLYCMDDVLAERGLDDAIPELPPMEREFWLLDQRMNQRGWKFDRKAVNDILAVVDEYKDEMRGRCVKMTGYKPSQTAKLTEWIRANGYPQLKNLQGDTVGAAVLDPECPPKVKDVLSLMNTYNLKAVTKLPAMLRSACADDRLRGMTVYHSAQTGRKAARIVQLQNIFRPMIKNPEDALIAFGARDLQWIRDLYLDADPDKSRNPMVVAGSCVRSVLIADEGKILIFVDFSAVEARGGAWLTNEKWKLDAFRAYDTIIPGEFDKKGKPLRAGPDLYRLNYAQLFGVSLDEIDELRRQSGKVIDLSFLYAGGVGAMLKMVKNYKLDLRAMTRAIWDSIPEDVMYKAKDNWAEAVFRKDTHGLPMDIYVACDSAKQLWRAIHPNANKGWYELEEQAIAAVSQPGTVHEALGGKVAFKKEGRWLYMRLPSGRRIPYFEPAIRETKRKNRHGEVRYGQKLVYVDARYGRADMYGGSFFNHVNQGHCRDLLCAAERRLESRGYWPVGSVHDEPVTEVDIEFGSLEEACEIMAHVPGFAKGMPIAVEGYRSHRYGKH